MKLAVPFALAGLTACGGSSPPPEKPVEPAPKKVNRVVVEDESANETPEEGVTFVKTKGTITQEAIEEGLAPHQVAMAECYTQKVGKRRWLGGRVVLQWNLRDDGTLTSVKLTESNLGSWAVEQCLLDIAWGATFGKPTGGGDVDFTVPLEFSAKGSSQSWNEDQALRAVGGQLAMLDDCEDFEYEPKPVKKPKKAKKAPKPKPKKDDKGEPSARPARPEKPPSNVTMTLYIGPGGKLQSLGFSSATTEVGLKWAACAEKVAQSWRLPDPRGQVAKLALRYKAAD
jgi:TonB family protein